MPIRTLGGIYGKFDPGKMSPGTWKQELHLVEAIRRTVSYSSTQGTAYMVLMSIPGHPSESHDIRVESMLAELAQCTVMALLSVAGSCTVALW